MEKDPQPALVLIGIIVAIWFLRTAYTAFQAWQQEKQTERALSPLVVSDGTILGDLFAEHPRSRVMTCRVDCTFFDSNDGGRCICGDGN
jgi:hypothetical protein